MHETVVIERYEPAVAVVRINRPHVRNALDDPTIDALYDAFTEMSGDSEIRVVILTGTDGAFCAGMDMSAPERAARRGDTVALTRGQERFVGLARTVRDLRQPVIAAVNGPAAGAGMGLALACDLRLVADDARFLVASIRIGLSAGECGISYHLPRIIGAGRAWEVMLTGRTIEAGEAASIGLVSRSYPPEELMAGAVELAHTIIDNSPFGVTQTKRVMRQALDSSFEGALALENSVQVSMTSTADFAEATRAFLEKRPPQFTGR